MPAKNRFSAYPDDVAKQKLEVIRKHEQDKAGTKPDGTPIKITDTWLLQDFVDVRHEAVAGGVTNRQKLGGMSDELKALRAEIIELKQTIGMLADLIKGEKEDVQPSDNQPSE